MLSVHAFFVHFVHHSLHTFMFRCNQDTRKHWSSLKPKYLFVTFSSTTVLALGLLLLSGLLDTRVKIISEVRFLFGMGIPERPSCVGKTRQINSVCLFLKYCCSIVL